MDLNFQEVSSAVAVDNFVAVAIGDSVEFDCTLFVPLYLRCSVELNLDRRWWCL